MKNLLCILSIVFLLELPGCSDRGTKQFCPEGYEEFDIPQLCGCGPAGVDILVVVDNSNSMADKQKLITASLNELVDDLTHTIVINNWHYSPIRELRVGFISSDFGLQYGSEYSTEGFPYGLEIPGCTDQESSGDDGSFQTEMPEFIDLGDLVACPPLDSDHSWAELGWEYENTALATQVSCLSALGTGGCGVEQPLGAAVKALDPRKNDNGFLRNTHNLAVLVISDEEDCSVQDPALFNLSEWTEDAGLEGGTTDPDKINTACTSQTAIEGGFLFPAEHFAQTWIEFKDDFTEAIMFAAIVGVPNASTSSCEGHGDELADCLDHPQMQYGTTACNRTDGNEWTTGAQPGRRYVEIAQSLGKRGYISSVCNDDWSQAMHDIAGMLHQAVYEQDTCYPGKRLPWKVVATQDIDTPACPNCGESQCEVMGIFSQYPAHEDKPTCPPELNTPQDQVDYEFVPGTHGFSDTITMSCPIPQLPAPLDCEAADAMYFNTWEDETSPAGWYYCETEREGFCPSNIRFTGGAKQALLGIEILIKCPITSPVDGGC